MKTVLTIIRYVAATIISLISAFGLCILHGMALANLLPVISAVIDDFMLADTNIVDEFYKRTFLPGYDASSALSDFFSFTPQNALCMITLCLLIGTIIFGCISYGLSKITRGSKGMVVVVACMYAYQYLSALRSTYSGETYITGIERDGEFYVVSVILMLLLLSTFSITVDLLWENAKSYKGHDKEKQAID